MKSLPLLKNNDTPCFPIDGQCPVCRLSQKRWDGVAYLSGGALLLNSNRTDEISASDYNAALEAFLSIGFHAKDDSDQSVNENVVTDLATGQFDINFCSLKCLRSWINTLIDQLEDKSTKQSDEAGQSP